jgi:hypothetical protein
MSQLFEVLLLLWFLAVAFNVKAHKKEEEHQSINTAVIGHPPEKKLYCNNRNNFRKLL